MFAGASNVAVLSNVKPVPESWNGRVELVLLFFDLNVGLSSRRRISRTTWSITYVTNKNGFRWTCACGSHTRTISNVRVYFRVNFSVFKRSLHEKIYTFDPVCHAWPVNDTKISRGGGEGEDAAPQHSSCLVVGWGGGWDGEDRKNLETSFACSAGMTTAPAAVADARLTYIRASGPWHENGYTRRTEICNIVTVK